MMIISKTSSVESRVTNYGSPRRIFSFLNWLMNYQQADLPGDLIAGIIVAIMLVPQGMTYALLAGLPPEVGLYASIVPLFIYGLLGSSRALAVGPTAIISLMVATGIAPLAGNNVALYIQLALILALLVGIIQLLMGILRVGFLVNFLSHPVLVGFTGAAAIVIGFSQLKHVLGFDVPRGEFIETVSHIVTHLAETNLFTAAIGLGSVLILLFFKHLLPKQLNRIGVPNGFIVPLSKSGPLFVIMPITLPSLDLNLWYSLLPTALVISFVGYMESISIAKSLASKRRQKIDPDQELIGLGTANLGAALTGGYPVTGGFSRSIVNFNAGANTGLASILTASLMGLTVIFLTPLFYYLPKAALAATILVAVVNLIDIKAARHIWAYNKADAMALLGTFTAVLIVGIEQGVLVGALMALALFIWRSSKPHSAIVGRIDQSELYRNEQRYDVQTWPEVLAIRVDESLYFANRKYLEELILGQIAQQPDVKDIVLIGTAINFIDASALETLESLHVDMQEAGVAFHLAAIKGPVLDRLRAIGFVDALGEDHFHFSTHDAMIALGYVLEDEEGAERMRPGEAAKAAQRRTEQVIL